MKKLFLLTALFVAAAFPSCSKHDNVETPDLPDPQPLAIAFADGNSLLLNMNESKTVNYTITGGSDKTVVKAELQIPDDAYTVETTPSSTSEGTITITAQTPETENCVIVTVSDGSQTVTAEIAVSTNAISEEDKLAITFAEGNSLEFNVGETQTVHYTITGGSASNVVKAEMQNLDDSYTLKTTPTSATEGTITIMAQMPSTENCVIVTVSDGNRSITAKIDVTLKASFDGKTVVVVTPGTLSQLLANYDESSITELTVIGNLNDADIVTLKSLPNLAVLDMENANLEELPTEAFKGKTSLTSVKLPKTLKAIGSYAFSGCSSLTSVKIPDGVMTIRDGAFNHCSSLTSITIPDSVTEIGASAFSDCSSLNAFYGKFASLDHRCLIVDGCLNSFAPAGLTSYAIPEGVTEIGDAAFWGCSSLTSIIIPNNVTTIGHGAFTDCSSLTSIMIPDSMTEIGGIAFQYCSNLKSITIGSSVTTIGASAFSDCSSLTSIYCKAIVPPSVSIHGAFNGVSATLYVPTGSKAAYTAADEWKNFSNIFEMD
ncbi:leucine-rich repeat domain-containing protein [uncultured Alistipes sp.]|uniref:leucine-rich repeat domain-containing protein n=1 Tax=uncultured Alistipes sp. TaxID=538949 RepID=UPI0025A398F5|nr:leucine-rich repeat domain-containing protein [uncultured Alistipes sp.]